jgi:hypothetical protein
MGFYSQVIVPLLCDFGLDRPFVAKYRRELFTHASGNILEIPPTVRFTTAVYGVHLPGTAYRMDEIPIPLRSFLPTDYPSDADVLNLIQEHVNDYFTGITHAANTTH